MSDQIIKTASTAQIRAARPDKSSWITANAGSGKTRVLTNRVSRLLLRGTDPSKILCLTFTTAAAAEMQNRLFDQLGAWAMLPDAELQSALQDLGEAAPSGPELNAARTLFARALETPGGLKIQTIHAFCESLLHRFPLEAEISPDFELIDDRQKILLQTDALNIMAQTHHVAFDAFVQCQTKDPMDYIPDIMRFQEKFEQRFDDAEVARLLGADDRLTPEIILAQVMQGFSDSDIDGLVVALLQGANKHDIKTADILAKRCTNSANDYLQLLETVFLSSGKPRKTTSFPGKEAKKLFPSAFEMISTFIDRISDARENRLALTSFQNAKILHEFAGQFLKIYEQEKSNRGQLEFEDLLRKTESLLRRSDMAQWVLYRLDGGIDHILVDEAQDTSPIQWQIVSALAEEIYATALPDRPRTVFVVGDEKQSIFSFQGADPEKFVQMQAQFDAQLKARNDDLAQSALLHSFRSAPAILATVDKVFQGSRAEGLNEEIAHLATDESRPGRVEIWPFLETPEKPEPKKWFEPIDSLPASDPEIVLAQNVAERIAELIATGHELPGKNRPVRASDFLVLVQSRKTIFHNVIKSLKNLNVPVAGADRLLINDEIAVKDLLACLQFAASPMDDLSLAAVLRSPLGGVSEAELFQLAHGRKSTLWPRVNDQPMLSDLLARADFDRPYELLERILIHHKGREKLLARLGAEAEDSIDELLRQALAFEQSNTPSLTGFLEWITADDIVVKRRMDDGSDQVRVMTVHGAKGLEAPIVIVPQTVWPANNSGNHVLPIGDFATIEPNAEQSPKALSDIKETRKNQLKEERNRLLYVALTRAETWLMIAGTGNRGKDKENWYDALFDGLQSMPCQTDSAGRLVYQTNWSERLLTAASAKQAKLGLPEWLSTPIVKMPKKSKLVSPSMLGGSHTITGTEDDKNAILRGNQIHLLLEKLPEFDPADWHDVANKLLAKTALPTVIDEAIAVLSAPNLAHIVDKTTLKEVAVSAEIKGIGQIFGRIDVLIVGQEITAVDFKSNAEVPHDVSDTPESFLRQMGAYRAALSKIWPDRVVKTAICWTRHAEVMEIPDYLSQAALERAAQT